LSPPSWPKTFVIGETDDFTKADLKGTETQARELKYYWYVFLYLDHVG